MKKLLCLCCCCLLLCSTACTAAESEPDRSRRVVKLSSSSQPAEKSSVSEEPEDTSEPVTDPLTSFVRISKVDQLPDYLLNNQKLYADLLENILKIYYTGLLNGKINSAIFSPRYASDELPSPQATPEERKRLAEYCTVGGALEYFGCDQENYMKYLEIFNGLLPYFYYDRDANIYPPSATPNQQMLKMNNYSQTLYFIFRYANDNKIAQDVLVYAAKNIDTYVKNYYQGILSGSISLPHSFTYTNDTLPPKGASLSERQQCADNATITGALDYAGFYTIYSPYITYLGYDTSSSLFTLPDFYNPNIIAVNAPDSSLSLFF